MPRKSLQIIITQKNGEKIEDLQIKTLKICLNESKHKPGIIYYLSHSKQQHTATNKQQQ